LQITETDTQIINGQLISVYLNLIKQCKVISNEAEYEQQKLLTNLLISESCFKSF